MDKKDEFKNFISNHPELIEYIKNKEMSFQDFYEIYDIYGNDEKAWSKYFRKNVTDTTKDKLSELSGIIKNVNLDNVEKYIDNAKKAIGIIQELTKKEVPSVTKIERPIAKFYGD